MFYWLYLAIGKAGTETGPRAPNRTGQPPPGVKPGECETSRLTGWATGWATVQNLVQDWGGHARVDSPPGRRPTFHVFLPACNADQSFDSEALASQGYGHGLPFRERCYSSAAATFIG